MRQRCRSFAGLSLCKVLGHLSITGTAKRRAIQVVSKAASRLWIKKTDPGTASGTQVGDWSPPTGSPGQGCLML